MGEGEQLVVNDLLEEFCCKYNPVPCRQPPPMAMDSGSLKYNIRWVERTFTSSAKTEALLAPERENLASHDYDAAINFLPGFHRHYKVCPFLLCLLSPFLSLFQLIGGALPIPLLYAVRKPHWSNMRSYLFLTTASCTGFLIGHVMSIYAHFSFVRSIENPAAFSQAMENIQNNTGASAPPGPLIIREAGKMSVDHDAPPLG